MSNNTKRANQEKNRLSIKSPYIKRSLAGQEFQKQYSKSKNITFHSILKTWVAAGILCRTTDIKELQK